MPKYTQALSPKGIVWICLGVLSTAFGFTMLIRHPKHPLLEELGRAAIIVVPFLFLQPFLGFWMLYDAIRYEAKPFRYFLLGAFVPFCYIWYYIERVRPRKGNRVNTQRGHANGSSPSD